MRKLSDADIVDIYARCHSALERQSDIAAEYGIAQTMVSHIKSGRRHRAITSHAVSVAGDEARLVRALARRQQALEQRVAALEAGR